MKGGSSNMTSMKMMMMCMCMASCMMSMMAFKSNIKKDENLTNALRSMAAAKKKLCQKCQTANWEGTTGVGADSPCADMKQNCIDEGLLGEEQVLSGGFQRVSFSEVHQANCNKCQQTNWEGSLPAFGSTIPCSEIKAECM
jgi:hypothetical protein